MIPAAFDYHAPASLPEAIALLSQFGDSAKVISGGQSLLPLLKLRLGAAVVAFGQNGERTIPIDQFFTGLFATALARDEILTEIRIPAPPNRSGGAYVKLERKVGDYATAAAAAQVTLDGSGAFKQVGLALTNAGPVPLRSTTAEVFLKGPR